MEVAETVKNLALFSGIELFLIIILIFAVILMIKLGPKWLDKRYQYKMAELNQENQHMEIETNAMVKEVATRLDRLEESTLKVQNQFAEDAEERKERQAQMDSKFESIDSEIKNIFAIFADHEEFAKDTSRGTLENMVCNDTVSPLRRLKAFRRLLAMGVNGIIKQRGMKIVLDHKDLWLEVLAMDMGLKVINQDYYDRVMDEIRKSIYGGVM